MIAQDLANLFTRDLERVANEINAYSNETLLWKLDGQISNTPGNLALHICGNLQHFIGATLGNSGYVRQRDKEFNDKNVPASEILQLIETTNKVVGDTLANLQAEKLEEEYPLEVMKRKWTTLQFILHLQGHLNYHLGQINYHRRLMDV